MHSAIHVYNSIIFNLFGTPGFGISETVLKGFSNAVNHANINLIYLSKSELNYIIHLKHRRMVPRRGRGAVRKREQGQKVVDRGIYLVYAVNIILGISSLFFILFSLHFICMSTSTLSPHP